MERLVINTDMYLECAGSCAGCFLTQEERASSQIFFEPIRLSLVELSKQHSDILIENLVIGFGRGNYLLLNEEKQSQLLHLIAEISELFNYKNITVEVSTSLVGKVDLQIENAKKIINKNRAIYFNVVLNSELSSKRFWQNVEKFYTELKKERESWGWLDNTADILVLSINPEFLPNHIFSVDFLKKIQSPLNIAVFPYQGSVTNEKLSAYDVWVGRFLREFRGADVNIINYIDSFYENYYGMSCEEKEDHRMQSAQSYLFIEKDGNIVSGLHSIMGEVDQVRLLNKYQLKFNHKEGVRRLNKNKTCVFCPYQDICLLSGAYLNFLANEKKANKVTGCLSGYRAFFEQKSAAFPQPERAQVG